MNSTPLIIVPAFNEEGKITETLHDLKHHGFKNIVVIDDGSGDETAKLAKKQGVIVLHHVINRGLGAALGTGFDYAKKHGFGALITFDADGQHQASDISKLIKPLQNNTADVVIGSRMFDQKNMPAFRILLNWISNFVTFFIYGVWTTDSLSGLRAFNAKAIGLIQIKTDRMEVSNEFFKEIKRNHLRLKEVPIKAIYTDYSKLNSKNLDPIDIGIKMLIRLFR